MGEAHQAWALGLLRTGLTDFVHIPQASLYMTWTQSAQHTSSTSLYQSCQAHSSPGLQLPLLMLLSRLP